MVSSGRVLPHTLIGAADRCCPAVCDYRPEMVATYLAMIRHARAAGLDLTAELAEGRSSGESLGRSPGVATSLDIRVLRRVWDIQRAQREGAETVDEICQKLCPWSLDDDPSQTA